MNLKPGFRGDRAFQERLVAARAIANSVQGSGDGVQGFDKPLILIKLRVRDKGRGAGGGWSGGLLHQSKKYSYIKRASFGSNP